MYLIPPRVFSILRSPIFLSAWALTCFRSSLLAGIAAFKVSLRSGSEDEAYVRLLSSSVTRSALAAMIEVVTIESSMAYGQRLGDSE